VIKIEIGFTLEESAVSPMYSVFVFVFSVFRSALQSGRYVDICYSRGGPIGGPLSHEQRVKFSNPYNRRKRI
jgi:hypothetical protein